MSNRRNFLQRAFGLGAALLAAPALGAASETPISHHTADPYDGPSSESAELIKSGHRHPSGLAFNAPVVTTDVGDLPFTMEGGWKVFRLTAQVIQRQVAPNKSIDMWGFNGSCPGPTIQVNHGDQVRVIFKNELPEPTSLHWHGFEDRIGFDGMPGISQEPIKPGGSFTYEFHITQEGTYFYHSHMAMQEMAGMLGAFIMHPRTPYHPSCDKDFAILLQEFWTLPNNTVPNTMNMEFNWLLINGRAGPATTPLIIRLGDRVRIRFINLGMDHHPMHIHGHTFYVTGTEGGRIPETAWWPGNTVLVGVAQARNIEFVANNPGDWMLHCHLPHHMMNLMASQAGPMTRDAGNTRLPLPRGSSEPVPTQHPFGEAAGLTPDTAAADPGRDASMSGMMSSMNSGEPKLGAQEQRDMMAYDMSDKAMKQQRDELSPNANNVPNFPQDAYMEGPMMTMDQLVAKPENLGLRPGWSRFMQGMMTFMRVLPPDEYDRVIAAMQNPVRPKDPYASLYQPSATNSRRTS